MKKSALISVALLIVIYFSAYVIFRQTHIEIWEKDARAYVIFPSDKVFLYYFFRPLSYLDEKFTGISFHIGPHR